MGMVVFSRNDALAAGRTIAGVTTAGPLPGSAQDLLIVFLQRGGRVHFCFERGIALSDQRWSVVTEAGGIGQGGAGESVPQPVQPEAGSSILCLTARVERPIRAGHFSGPDSRPQPGIARAGHGGGSRCGESLRQIDMHLLSPVPCVNRRNRENPTTNPAGTALHEVVT